MVASRFVHISAARGACLYVGSCVRTTGGRCVCFTVARHVWITEGKYVYITGGGRVRIK
jgi:hypothetical protein